MLTGMGDSDTPDAGQGFHIDVHGYAHSGTGRGSVYDTLLLTMNNE